MVRVTGQLDAPLVDIGAMRQDYWERQEVQLPSLARIHKPTGWRKYFYKTQAPKLILKRLDTSDWERINNEHFLIRESLTKDMPAIRRIQAKLEKMKRLNAKERAFMVDLDERTKPMLLSILASMIIEPKMVYEEVVLMFELLDEFDSKTLIAIVNSMTSEKASVATAVAKERTDELNKMRSDLRASV